MGKIRWQTPIQLRSLLNELVSWKSVTSSPKGRDGFRINIRDLLQTVSYFQKYDQYISLHHADKGRKFLTALYKHPKAVNTVCLISHFDTVNTSEYGKDEALATKPDQLTKVWADSPRSFHQKLPEIYSREASISGGNDGYENGAGTPSAINGKGHS